LKTPLKILAGFFILAGLYGRPLAAGDALVTATIGEPVNLIPIFATDSASAQISRLIFNGLLKYDKDLHLVGDLAESWRVEDGGLRLVFQLRKNVKWQDGAPFTADDVEFTFRKLIDPQNPTPYGADFEKVASLTVTGPATVEILYKEPFSPGLASWTMGIIPKHLLEHENLLTTPFSRRPVGTGPYRLVRWKTGERLELAANPDYFEGAALIDRYLCRIIPDPATIFLELEMENVDWTALTPLQYSRLSDTAFLKKKYRKFRVPSFGYAYLGYNEENPLFRDKHVRRAIGLAIDKEQLVETVLLGLGRVATGPFLPESWAYNPEVRPSPYDPDLARRLLKEAGWEDTDKDGVLDKGGQRFSFTILTNHGNLERQMACEMIQKMLGGIGIEVKIRVVEWGTFLKEFIDKKNFEAVLLGWQLSPDPDVFDIFHSSRSAPGNFNFVSYKNQEVDRLLEEARRHFDEKGRAELYRRVHEILAEEEPYTFLYVPEALPILHRRFRNVEAAHYGIGHDLIRWEVPAEEMRYPSPKRAQ
jgi:peptide/nickel transport system substrate-binding protein